MIVKVTLSVLQPGNILHAFVRDQKNTLSFASAPATHIASRFRKGETVAYFHATLDKSGIELGDRAEGESW